MIEIVLRKIGESGDVSEIILALLPTVGTIDSDHSTDIIAFGWCKTKINSANAVITRNGKNWYVNVDSCILTVNAYSYTIITAHREKK